VKTVLHPRQAIFNPWKSDMTSTLSAILFVLLIQQQPIDQYRQLCRDISSPDSTVSASALRSVNHLTRTDATIFLRLLKDTSADIRSGATIALLSAHSATGQAVHVLTEALNDTSESVLISVTAALSVLISPVDTFAVAALVKLIDSKTLQSRNSSALFYSVRALKTIGPAAQNALSSIRKLYRNRRIRSDVQGECYEAIQAIRAQKQSP
jgi:hypothetical protein